MSANLPCEGTAIVRLVMPASEVDAFSFAMSPEDAETFAVLMSRVALLKSRVHEGETRYTFWSIPGVDVNVIELEGR